MKLKRFGWTLKDEKYRKWYFVFELRKNVLRALLNIYTYRFFSLYFNNCFRKITPRSSLALYKRYCLFTYTGRVVFKSFKLSRHSFKHIAAGGYLTGFRKSSF